MMDPRETVNQVMGTINDAVAAGTDPYALQAATFITMPDVSAHDTLVAISAVADDEFRLHLFDLIHRLHAKLGELVKRIPGQ